MPVKILKKDSKNRNLIKVKRKDIGEVWGYRIWIRNRRKTVTGFPTRTDAESALAALKLRLLYARHGISFETKKVKLAPLIEDYITHIKAQGASEKHIYRSGYVLGLLKSFLPDNITLQKITQAEMKAYQQHRLREGISPQSINKEMSTIKTFFRMLPTIKEGLEWMPPSVSKLKEPNPSHRILSQSEIEAIKQHLPLGSWERDCFVVALETAMRISEIVTLRKEYIYSDRGIGFELGSIRFITPKTGTSRIIPITPNVAEILSRRLMNNDTPYIFPYSGNLESTTEILRRLIIGAAKKAGITSRRHQRDGFTFHHLRHTAITRMVEMDVQAGAIQAITGHSNRHMVMLYTHPTSAQFQRAYEALKGEDSGEVGAGQTPDNLDKQGQTG